jgi:hypothetical protein
MRMRREDIRKVSGDVNDDRPLVDFFYMLLRDHLPAGTVEKLVQEAEEDLDKIPMEYTNGYIAKYAQMLAGRLSEKKNG